MAQPLPDQTMARGSPLSLSALPTTTEPSLLIALAYEVHKLSVLSVPRSVLVAQPLPDQTVAWLLPLPSRSEAPTTTEPSPLVPLAVEDPVLSLFSVPRSVLVAQLLPDQTVARPNLPPSQYEVPTTIELSLLKPNACEIPELSLRSVPRSVMLSGAAAAGSAASSAARVKRRCAGDDLRIVMFSLFRL